MTHDKKEKSNKFLGIIRIPDYELGSKYTPGCEKGNCFNCCSIHKNYCAAKVEIAYALTKWWNKIRHNENAAINIQRTQKCQRELSPNQIIYRAINLQHEA